MREKLKVITEDTVIPISLVLTLAGGIFWLSQVHAKAESAASLAEQEMGMLQSINQRLAHIEGFLERQEKTDE